MQSNQRYPNEGSSRLPLDSSRLDYAEMNMSNTQEHHYIDEAAAAAAASINAAQYVPYTSPLNDSSHSDKGTSSSEKVKRAKSMQKITRNRKITSCLQCRERKQKVRRAARSLRGKKVRLL